MPNNKEAIKASNHQPKQAINKQTTTQLIKQLINTNQASTYPNNQAAKAALLKQPATGAITHRTFIKPSNNQPTNITKSPTQAKTPSTIQPTSCLPQQLPKQSLNHGNNHLYNQAQTAIHPNIQAAKQIPIQTIMHPSHSHKQTTKQN